jgi:hypothetical protein
MMYPEPTLGPAGTARRVVVAAGLLYLAGGANAGSWSIAWYAAVLVLSNWILRRDDEVGCPVFAPIDAAEARHRSNGQAAPTRAGSP